MADGGDYVSDVRVIQSGDGVLQVEGDASAEVGG
jgi:hypothetical protein